MASQILSLRVLPALCILACSLGRSIAANTTTTATSDLISAAYTISATTTSFSSTTLTATGTDENVILVEETGAAYLTDVTIIKTGDTTSSDDSSFTTLNAAIGVETNGTIYMYGCNITTDGLSANGLHTYEDGASAYLYDLYISATGDGSHGIYTAGGYIYAENLVCSTYDSKGSAIATDKGGGTIVVDTATVHTYGTQSALLYSTGNITVANMTGASAVAPAACIDGSNSFTITDSTISAGPELHGVFQVVSTVSSGTDDEAYVYVTGGSVAETRGTFGLIYVGNINAHIYLSSVEITITSGILANASADSEYGTSGANQGVAYITLTNEKNITGDVYVDDISTISLSLLSTTTYSGAINQDNSAGNATLYLDSESSWTVTGTSYLQGLVDEDESAGNIYSGGFTVYYNGSANAWLGNRTVELSGGGSLKPEP
ncbi:MAG: hypothetical protein M1834_002219 [Cirrosporium novae-zelandiae]|nr:MAG: hypothetical protein M1834_002219 [Cirrosporium novae-zelandiae]